MSKVYIGRKDHPPLFLSWAVYRVGDIPFRLEAEGFTTVSEAKRWAKKWGHEIVRLTAKGAK